MLFLHRLPSLNTASVAKQRFYIKRSFQVTCISIFFTVRIRPSPQKHWLGSRVGTTRLAGRAGRTTGRAGLSRSANGPGQTRMTTGRTEKFRPVIQVPGLHIAYEVTVVLR
jgi:hypothetical protein